VERKPIEKKNMVSMVGVSVYLGGGEVARRSGRKSAEAFFSALAPLPKTAL
jgi:hypothetical protein